MLEMRDFEKTGRSHSVNPDLPLLPGRQLRELWAHCLEAQDLGAMRPFWEERDEFLGKTRIVYSGGFFFLGEVREGLPNGAGYLAIKDNLTLLKGIWVKGRLVSSY
jgi:hypothetical protein